MQTTTTALAVAGLIGALAWCLDTPSRTQANGSAAAITSVADRHLSQTNQPDTEAVPKGIAPAPEHKRLAEMTGTWLGTVRMKPTPDAEWLVSDVTLTRELVLDGRFLLERVESEVDGQPFEGITILGYNTLDGKYESVWLESLATHIAMSEGTYNAAANLWRFKGEHRDPATGNRYATTTEIDDSVEGVEIMTTTMKSPDGETIRVFEGRFTRE